MLTAMIILKRIGFESIRNHEQVLLKRTLDGLTKLPGVILYGDNEVIADRVGIVVFNLWGIKNEDVASLLAGDHGIAVRHAAFCAHSYVRRLVRDEQEINYAGATCFPPETCSPPEGMVRVSFGIYNNEIEVDWFLTAINRMCRRFHPDVF
jgi:selenocysteine lyase/cysteine desulfurase